MILPSAIEAQRITGGGTIDATFYHTVDGMRVSFVLVGVRCRFLSGSGTATFTIGVQDYGNGQFSMPLDTIAGAGDAAGTVKHVNFGLLDEELKLWRFFAHPDKPGVTEGLTIDWTDPGTSTWALTVFTAPTTAVR